ncbi:MAG: sodium-translocating pyrophosphatase [Phycisphaerae bacterium]|nr:sodium-translocating pyrophosphatase [Phycisphaerae bacterium]
MEASPGRRMGLLVAILGVWTVLAVAAVAAAQPSEAATAPGATQVEESTTSVAIPLAWWIAPAASIVALLCAYLFYRQVRNAPDGDEKMREIAAAVREGAYAYLRRQYKVVAMFFVVAAALLFVMGWVFHIQSRIVFVAFLMGGFFSALCGYFGMKTATMASSRTAQGAKESLNRGLVVAFRAGAVMGLVVVGFGLLFITLWFFILTQLAPLLGYSMNLMEVTVVMLTFGMGASSQALFARLGGGIFTKAADVGADLVGKIEANIPEDDPRNPAVIADNVGDNVGDVAGMGADLFESYCGSVLSTAVLGVAAALALGLGVADQVRMVAAPMALAGIGIVLSVVGILLVRTREDASMKQLMGALNRGINGSTLLTVLGALGVCYFVIGPGDGHTVEGVSWLGVWGAIVVGLLAGVIIGKGTEYFTSYDYKPTQEVARQSETGPATVIIGGLAEGMQSTWLAILTVVVGIILAYTFAGGLKEAQLGLYGIAIASVGMLSTLGITLATDAYGPIADNAGGNAEMTHQPPEVRKRTDALDSLGNTTAATGKGFAIGSAALTALALLAAYMDEVRVGQNREAEAAIVRVVPDAGKLPAVGVGALHYLGHGKFAAKLSAGTTATSFHTLMALDMPPAIKASLKRGQLPGAIVASPISPPNERKVRTLALKDAKGKIHTVQLVSSHEATLQQYVSFYDVTLINPKVIGGLMIGVLLVFMFSAAAMKAVGRAANSMVKEVRRQFAEIPGLMAGTAKPDYARCVEISTAGAQREMVLPSVLALATPVVVGLIFDVAGVLGLLAGGLCCGFATAVYMANAGGAWDNAKKYIESGQYGGKGSPRHKAAVVGDTVGDPFKDTAGPCLNILIKLMSMVAVVFAGLTVTLAPQIGSWLGIN